MREFWDFLKQTGHSSNPGSAFPSCGTRQVLQSCIVGALVF